MRAAFLYKLHKLNECKQKMKKSQKKISTIKNVGKCRKITYTLSYAHYPPIKCRKK